MNMHRHAASLMIDVTTVTTAKDGTPNSVTPGPRGMGGKGGGTRGQPQVIIMNCTYDVGMGNSRGH